MLTIKKGNREEESIYITKVMQDKGKAESEAWLCHIESGQNCKQTGHPTPCKYKTQNNEHLGVSKEDSDQAQEPRHIAQKKKQNSKSQKPIHHSLNFVGGETVNGDGP